MCDSIVGSTSAWHAVVRGSVQACYITCKNMALNIRETVSLGLSDETIKVIGPFYLVSMPGEVKYPTLRVDV